LFDFRLIVESIPLLVKGAVYTVQVSVLAIVFGLVLGWMLGLVAVSGVRWLRAIAWGYVQFIRGTPLLVQIFLIYFGLPTLGINIPAYWSGVIALGLNSAGFQAEIVRAGIESIDRGQTEAARALGLTYMQTRLYVVAPQAFRVAIPLLTSIFSALFRNSALVSAIGVSELLLTADRIQQQNFLTFQLFTIAGIMYLSLTLPLAWASARLEQKVAQAR